MTADQSLTFGVYRLCALVDDSYTVTEEGIFYADDLPAKERKVLEAYMRTAISDVASFPPRFPLYSRSRVHEKSVLASDQAQRSFGLWIESAF